MNHITSIELTFPYLGNHNKYLSSVNTTESTEESVIHIQEDFFFSNVYKLLYYFLNFIGDRSLHIRYTYDLNDLEKELYIDDLLFGKLDSLPSKYIKFLDIIAEESIIYYNSTKLSKVVVSVTYQDSDLIYSVNYEI